MDDQKEIKRKTRNRILIEKKKRESHVLHFEESENSFSSLLQETFQILRRTSFIFAEDESEFLNNVCGMHFGEIQRADDLSDNNKIVKHFPCNNCGNV